MERLENFMLDEEVEGAGVPTHMPKITNFDTNWQVSLLGLQG